MSANRMKWLTNFKNKFIEKEHEIKLDKSDPKYYGIDRWYTGFDANEYLICIKLIEKKEGGNCHVWEAETFVDEVRFSKKSYFKWENLLRCTRLTSDQEDKLNKKLQEYIAAEDTRLRSNRERAERELTTLLS